MNAFDYCRPTTIDDAARAMRTLSGAKLLAGGQTLIPVMKLRFNRPDAIVDLGAIAELKGIRREADTLVIGAMTTHAEVAESKVVASAVKGLADLAEGIGDPHVRNRGTIGGALANNDPAADYPAAVLSLAATLKTTKRTVHADNFFKSVFTTALDEDEILIEIAFPIPKRFAYAKFASPASRFALVGVAVGDTVGGVRVAVTGAANSGVFRLKAAESALSKSFSPAAVSGMHVDPSGLSSDMHADAAYRSHLTGVMAQRAVRAAAS